MRNLGTFCLLVFQLEGFISCIGMKDWVGIGNSERKVDFVSYRKHYENGFGLDF